MMMIMIMMQCTVLCNVDTAHCNGWCSLLNRIFSERELTFTICYRPSVCRL